MDADIVIIGGGCAGLSLATLLADRGADAPRVIVVEPRYAYSNDRTWSGWRARPNRFTDCARASWSRWSVSYQGRQVIRAHSRMPYDTIPGDRFYETATAAIAGAPQITLQMGTLAGSAMQQGNTVRVATDRGELRAHLAIDTRPPPAAAGGGLLQSFVGLEIETDSPCFVADTVGLMAFEAASAQAIAFLYTLPFSPTRALLELTHMSPSTADLPDEAGLAALLRERLGCDFRIIRAESGCLPMRPLGRAPAPPGRVLQLGSPAGALRASTGYGFANIQAQAAALADTLTIGVQAAVDWQAARPAAWMRGMDAMFLRVLRRQPEIGPDLLTTLFRRCPSAPLIRFLSGTGGLLDGGQVALSMPKIPFMRDLAWRA